MKPPLKWAGGKRWLVPYLTDLWQSHSSRQYVEPFCGGLAVSLGLRPNIAVLNDVNPHLINFYRHLQRGLEITIEMKNEEKGFYSLRSRFNSLISDGGSQSAEAAQLFYYLNRTCFNGLCRFNRSGEFNVPFGKHSTITYAADFAAYESVFRNWVFTCGDLDELRTEPRPSFMLIRPMTSNSPPTVPEVWLGRSGAYRGAIGSTFRAGRAVKSSYPELLSYTRDWALNLVI